MGCETPGRLPGSDGLAEGVAGRLAIEGVEGLAAGREAGAAGRLIAGERLIPPPP
jgi:hypothetical protein